MSVIRVSRVARRFFSVRSNDIVTYCLGTLFLGLARRLGHRELMEEREYRRDERALPPPTGRSEGSRCGAERGGGKTGGGRAADPGPACRPAARARETVAETSPPCHQAAGR